MKIMKDNALKTLEDITNINSAYTFVYFRNGYKYKDDKVSKLNSVA
jgi:CRISPR/Cas system-associated protein Cas7 (RAMP superfamily)